MNDSWIKGYTMHLFDITVLVFFLYVVVRGYFRGLLQEAFNLFGIFGGGLIAARFGPKLALIFQNNLKLSPAYNSTIAFTMIWIFFYVLMFFCGIFFQRIVKLLLMEWVDKLGGIIFGILKGFLMVGLATVSFLKFPLIPAVYKNEIEKTIIVKNIARFTPKTYNAVIDTFSWERFENYDLMMKKSKSTDIENVIKDMGNYNKTIEKLIGE